MELGFWKDLPKPFSVLAPMEEVTDSVFRQIVASCTPPDVFFTEFVNVEGLCSRGREKIIHRLQFTEIERPIVAQIWGMQPENFYKIAQELVAMGFDGVDINMGCPERSIVKRGSCAGLINNPKLASEIIQAVKEGVRDGLKNVILASESVNRRRARPESEPGTDPGQARMTKNKVKTIPVSVKTRIGINHIVTEDWIGFLLKQDLAALTVHGRTIKEQSEVPAHWDEIGKAVVLRDALDKETIIIGNGDVMNWQDALEKVRKYRVDGVMIGRGIFHDLWAFEKKITPNGENYSSSDELERGVEKLNKDSSRCLPLSGIHSNHRTLNTMLELLLKHVRLFEKTWQGKKNFLILRRFFKIYVSGFPHVSNLREQLMQTSTIEEVEKVVKQYINLSS